MADCRSPIVSVRSQPLWHNVAIRSVFIVIMKRCTHLPFLAPFAILRRSMQTKKNWLNTNWQVIDATATSKEVAGTENGSPLGCIFLSWKVRWIAFLRFQSPHGKTAPPFPLTYLYKLSIEHVLAFVTVCLVYSTKAQLHMNAKP